MVSATAKAHANVQEWINKAAVVRADMGRTNRLSDLQCKFCFYGSRWLGAGITTRDCTICGVESGYPTLDTDALCAPCAAANDLCKHCGGDRKMRVRRKNWPAPLGK